MVNFIAPTNVVVVKGSPDIQDAVTEGTMTEMKPGRLVIKGTTDAQVVIGGADALSVGWLSFEDTPPKYQPANIDTAYAVADKVTVVNGPGIHVMATATAAVDKGALVEAAVGGKVTSATSGTVVGKAEETIGEAGVLRIRSLI